MNFYCMLLGFFLLHLLIICQAGSKSKSKKKKSKEKEDDIGLGASFKLRTTSSKKRQRLVESDIPYPLQLEIYKHLFSSHFAFKKSLSEKFQFNCQSNITSKVLRKYPMSMFIWTYNGEVLKESDRIHFTNGKIEIKRATKSDDGVYVCKLEYSTKKFVTMAVFSLVIDSGKTDFTLNKLKPFQRLCPSIVFGLLFKKATKEWKHNGTYYERFGRTSAKDFSKADFAPLNENMTGKWDCVVNDGATKRLWTVMSFNIVVRNPKEMEAKAKQLLREKPVLFGILVASPVLAVFLIILFVCYKPNANSDYQKLVPQKGSKDDAHILQEVIQESEESDIEK